MGLFDFFKKKKKQPKTHKVTLNYDEIEKSALEKDGGINTVLINGIEFVIKEDVLFSAFGHFKANAYGTVDGIQVKVDMTDKMFLDNHKDIKPEYIEKIANLLQDFKNRYDVIVDRISTETANYLNAQKLRDEPYTQKEVKENIDTKNITVFFAKDCAFCAWLDDDSVFYSEYEDGQYKVEFNNDEEDDI
ncbi:MAG: hypothetical protein HDT28_08875 [Clostridiales bacterium]|nr:hypothetical protein [Clostridiales bacterium]